MKKLFTNLAVLTFSLLLAVVLLEVAIRGFGLFGAERRAAADAVQAAAEFEEKDETEGLEPSAHWVIHPFRGVSPRPLGPTDVPGVNYNVLGIHSREPDPRLLPEDELVVGIFGGSVARGLALTSHWAIKEAMEVSLGQGRAIRVVNFGVSGYKQPQQVNLLAELILLETPLDVVVNVDGFNEVVLSRANALKARHPLYPDYDFWTSALGTTTGSLSNRQIQLLARTQRQRQKFIEIGEALAASPWKGLAAVEAAVGWRALEASGNALLAEQEMRQLPIRKLEDDLWHVDDPCLVDADTCWDLYFGIWQRSSRLMAQVAEHGGARYFHVLQPNQYVEGSKTQLHEQELAVAWQPNHPWSRWAREGYSGLRETGRELASEGELYLDATQIYRSSKDMDYGDSCCHMTHEGYRKLAVKIGSWVGEVLSAEQAASSTPEAAN